MPPKTCGSTSSRTRPRVAARSSVSLNIRDFASDLVPRGWMSSSGYLGSIESGTEVFTGNGRLDTASYSVTLQ
jgi:xyloglucan-specific endo-beta-1,4-glucanase